jgi:ABC-type transport system substrate-binding protein
LSLLLPYTTGIFANTGEAVAAQLAAVGINLKVTVASTLSQFVADIPNYDMYEAGTDGSHPTAFNYQTWCAPGGYYLTSNFGIDDTVLDGLYKKALSTLKPLKYWKAIEIRITKQAYTIPIVDQVAPAYYNPKKVTGWQGGLDAQTTDLRPATKK